MGVHGSVCCVICNKGCGGGRGWGGEFREVAGTTTGDSREFWWSHGYEQAMLTDPLLTDVLRTLRNKNQLEWREGTQSTEVASEVLRTGWPWDVF